MTDSDSNNRKFDTASHDDQFLAIPIEKQIGETWPTEGRIAGIDYGTVRIGLSICDPTRTWVSPLTTYNRRNERLDAQFFVQTQKNENIVSWVLGLPIHCDGRESQKSSQVREFAEWLFELTKLPIRFFDERYTTKLANRLLGEAELTNKQRKRRIDRVAAHLILEHFLEYDKAVREDETPQV